MNKFIKKSKSLPQNLNNYENKIKKSPSLNNLLLDNTKTIIKTFEFRGSDPIGIYFTEIDNKIIILTIKLDSLASAINDIVVGMELICINKKTITDYKKTMEEIKIKYKKYDYISLTFRRIIHSNINVFEKD